MRHRGIYACVSRRHLQLVSESEKAANVGTNEVEPDFEKGMEIAEPEKKKIKLVVTQIQITLLMTRFGVIRNASNESCLGVEQPTKNSVSILSDILDQRELDENDCELRNPTQVTSTVPSVKIKARYQDSDTNV